MKNFRWYILIVVLSATVFTLSGQQVTSAQGVNVIAVDSLEDDTSENGNCTLREAVRAANTRTLVDQCLGGDGDIVISLGVGRYQLAAGVVVISTDLKLSGMGQDVTIVDAMGIDSVFTIEPGVSVEISDLTIQNGRGLDIGGILNFGSLLLDSVTVAFNSGSIAGGIFSVGDTLTVQNSTIARNDGFVGAGGILVDGGNVNIKESTISDNVGAQGGGIWASGGATAVITNTTVSGNSATVLDGGGIFNTGSMFIGNSTITGNTAGRSGGGIHSRSQLTLVNTIVAGNDSSFGPDCSASTPFESLGHNLIGDLTDCDYSGAQGDLLGDSVAPALPELGPLQDNGGTTRTHALLFTSPAIDAGDDGACPDKDQRGVARPIGAACDIGSYEAAIPVEVPTLSQWALVILGVVLTLLLVSRPAWRQRDPTLKRSY